VEGGLFEAGGWLASIRTQRRDGPVAGMAFAIDGRHVATCRTVVARAGAEGAGGEALFVDFPLLGADGCWAETVGGPWRDGAGGGSSVAILRLIHPPRGLRPALLSRMASPSGQRFRCYGTVPDQVDPVRAGGRFGVAAGPPGGLLTAEFTTEPPSYDGFRGTALWSDELGAVIGLLVVQEDPGGGRQVLAELVHLAAAYSPLIAAAVTRSQGEIGDEGDDEASVIRQASALRDSGDYRAAIKVFRDSIRSRARRNRPSEELQKFLHGLLQESTGARQPDGGAAPVPHQLPPMLHDFEGRAVELDSLRLIARTATADPGAPIVIVAINGIGGIGKTALAVHFAHQLEPQYPDGQLYVNLHGYEPHQRLRPDQVLDRFLRDLGVADRALPTSLDEQISLYNKLLRDKRMLLLVDNASSSADVRPLIPNTPTCFVLVTSRDALTGLLATNDTRILTLNALGDDEALHLLKTVSRRDMQAPEEIAAAKEIVRLSANLPLAIWIAGAKLASRSSLTFSGLADLLRDEGLRLSRLRAGDLAIEANFETSYRDVSPPTAQLFRRLGLIAGPDFSADAAAAVAGEEYAVTLDALDELLDAHLVEPANAENRYRFHDLLRLFARKKLQASDDERKTSLERLLNWYLAGADTAGDLVMNSQRLQRFRAQYQASRPITGRDGALAWLEDERISIAAAIRQSSETDLLSWAWNLADALWGFCYLRKHWADWIENHQIGLDAARRAGDPEAEAWMLTNLGVAYWDTHEADRALSSFQQALSICRPIGFLLCEGRAIHGMGLAYREKGQYDQALECAERALPIRRRVADTWGEAVTLDNLAYVCGKLRQFDRAVDHFNDALAIWRQLNDPWGEGLSENDLGCVYNEAGNYAEAAACLRKSLEIRRAAGDRWGEAESLGHLGDALLNTEGIAAARQCWAASLDLFTQIQAPEATAIRDKLAAAGGE
jgi:tetratricopeptide (TPR) repeat protein